jgi:nitrogen fixation/metabolism regulation signal transduction histidine kinase
VAAETEARKPLHSRPVMRRRGLPFQSRIVLLTLAGGVPALLTAFLLLRDAPIADSVHRLILLVLIGAWAGFAVAVHRATVEPLRSIANLLEALRGGDYAIRGRHARKGDALGDIVLESNRLGATLRSQRFEAIESSALLNKVLAEVDVAVFAFDGDERIRLANRAAGALLRRHPDALIGLSAADVGFDTLLDGPAVSNESHTFPGRAGRWQIMREVFHEAGLPFRLLVVTDLSQALRDEERRAWRRLIRVIWHELNNSLAPIKSIAGTLGSLLDQTPEPADWRDDMQRGLDIIAARADALSRFTASYARLARLPPPVRAPIDFDALMRRVVALEPRLPIELVDSPALRVSADPDQLEQLLINVVRNAVDAALETNGRVRVGWCDANHTLEAWIDDEGPGLRNTANLFVPFFTTKPGGSGIGLVLSRQIAEAHGGSLLVDNRADRRGVRARLRLPL